MLTKKLIVILLLTTSFFNAASVSGEDSSVNFENLFASLPTPQAQALYRFGSVPVSPYTGKADISIPVYSTEVCSIPLTVSLNYDTRGVLVNSIPGCAGHGWTLNSGGMITREQQGWPDEADIVADPNPVRFHNYFHSLQKLNEIEGFNNLSEMAFYSQDIWEMGTYIPEGNRYFTDKYDFCADIFHFNFLGKSGYFFFDADGQWKVQCDDNFKVIFDVNDQQSYIESFGGQQYYSNTEHSWVSHKSIRGFTLIDDAGNKYIFGGDNDCIDYSIDAMNSTDDSYTNILWTANSWYLTRVEDRFGHIVYEFLYEREGCVYQAVYRKEKQTVKFYGSESGKYEYTNEESPFCITLSSPVYLIGVDINDNQTWTPERYISLSYGESLRGDVMYPYVSTGSGSLLYSQLGTIRSRHSWVNTGDIPVFPLEPKNFSTPVERDLNYTGIPLLDEIVISASGTEEKRYRLQYSRTGKVHLTEVQVIADDGFETNIGKYTLEYNSYEDIPTNYYSLHTDLWGYFNGSYSTDRNASAIAAEHGTLREITYPTGGKTKLWYEPNHISAAMIGGGLRIKMIEDYDSDGITLLNRRIYTYGSPVNAVVQPRMQGTYNTYSENLRITYDCDYSLVPLADYYGPAVGYMQVTEERNTSRTVYTYTTATDAAPYNTFGDESLFSRKGSKAFLRGRLARKRIYDTNGFLYREIFYSYYCSSGDLLTALATNMSGHATIFKSIGNNYIFAHRPPIVSLTWMAGCVYSVFLSKNNLTGVTTYTYSTTGTIEESTRFNRSDIAVKGGTQPYQFIVSETSSQKGTTTAFEYPVDSVRYNDFALIHYFPAIKSTVRRSGAFLYSDTIVYAPINGNLNPHYEIRDYGQVRDTMVTYTSFYSNGLPEGYIQKGMPPTRIFRDEWGHILGKICSNINLNQITFNPTSSPENTLTYNGKSIFRIPNTAAVVYKWNDMQLLESITTGIGQTTYYYYDTINRLKEIRDSHGNIQQLFDYHYITE